MKIHRVNPNYTVRNGITRDREGVCERWQTEAAWWQVMGSGHEKLVGVWEQDV